MSLTENLPRRPLPERLFWPAIIVLLATMGAMMSIAARLESQTFDEALHLTAGFSYWKTGDFRLNREHPPLSKLLTAFPLLFTAARLPDRPEAWRKADQIEMSTEFLYRNGVDADTLLLLGRSVTILLTLTLGLVIAMVARRRWGAAAGLVALGLYATDPNFIAHGHYITSDVPVSLAMLISVLIWDRYLRTGRGRDLVLAAAALGGALATKFSAVFLLPVHWLVYFLRRPAGHRRPLVASIGAVLILLLTYGPASWKMLQGHYPPLADQVGDSFPAAAWFSAISRDLRLPAHPYLEGIWFLFLHTWDGHRSYLLGRISEEGSVWYFPVAVAVKTPVAVLALLLVAAVALAVSAKRVPRSTWLLALFPAAYFAICLNGRLNLGLRHLLPVYPFLYLWIGWAVAVAVAGRWKRPAMMLLVLAGTMQTAEIARASPHYTAFFNAPAGGPENGYRYLLDSNLDWGQDLKKLKKWMDRQRLEKVCLSYFGMADPYYYGIADSWLPGPDSAVPDCVAAVSLTHLYDVYFETPRHQWLRKRKPMTTIGHSIWIFDLRKQPSDKVAP